MNPEVLFIQAVLLHLIQDVLQVVLQLPIILHSTRSTHPSCEGSSDKSILKMATPITSVPDWMKQMSFEECVEWMRKMDEEENRKDREHQRQTDKEDAEQRERWRKEDAECRKGDAERERAEKRRERADHQKFLKQMDEIINGPQKTHHHLQTSNHHPH